MLGVAGVFGGSLFSAMHRLLKTVPSLDILELKNWVNCRNVCNLKIKTNTTENKYLQIKNVKLL